jgi:phage tail sheath protein FI
MATYKTPDVYVEEIPLFPPSVAEVETAVPAFIGYTEKADEYGKDDLKNVPTKVTSLLEYKELFGGAPPITVDEIVLDENSVVESYVLKSNFYMYDSLRLFFKNGGGKCYIISIGTYDAGTPNKSHFETGLAELRKKDEPTIILFPDAVLFAGNDLYSIQQSALKQCEELQDRFSVFDLLEKAVAGETFKWQKGVDDFRDNIGINYLKYGAAYTPWLKTNLGISVKYRDVRGKIVRGGKTVTLDVLTDNKEVEDTLSYLDDAVDDVEKIVETDLAALIGGKGTLKAKYITLQDDFKGAPATDKFKALFTFIYDVADKIDEWAGLAGTLKGGQLITDLKNLIKDSLKASVATLIGYDRGADTELTGTYNLFSTYDPVETTTEWDHIFESGHANHPDAVTSIYTGATNAEKMRKAEPKITSIFNQVNAAVTQIVSSAQGYEKTHEGNLYESHSIYKNIITKLSGGLTTLPPSGAVAGIYAMVDNARGVWKAPANVSLSSVVGVTEIIDNQDQEDLNVDVVAGKSINAIRGFTGKGTLIWGARTLAGNDNEWRYISVRRFFNMVEESVKKSTYWAVFEPNDANTWIKVKSMIENYLIQKWRDGALAGSKPEEAFYVKVGLGVTMTAQDILEGRMNVEIGMAVVRPAEFIILKFSHKMQES